MRRMAEAVSVAIFRYAARRAGEREGMGCWALGVPFWELPPG